MRRSYKKHEYTAEDLVIAWKAALDSGENVSWIARNLDTHTSTIYQDAKALRKLGVNLPGLGHKRGRTDKLDKDSINKLNEIMED